MRNLIRTTLLTAVLGAALLAAEARSIVVAPTAIYLDHRTRSATLTLFNPSNVAEEVTIHAIFGFPTTDADGRLHLFTEEDSDDPRSAAGWLRAFPQRVVVQPGARQVVRLLGEPPAGLDDGEYWARLVVTSRGQSLPLAAPGDSAEVRVGLDLEIRTIIATSYRKGNVTTGLRVEAFEPRIEAGRLHLRPRLVREGPGAYIGAMKVQLEDDAGRVVRSWSEQIAVYREYHRRFEYEIGTLPAGRYTVRATFTTVRADIPPAHRLDSRPVERSVEVIVR